MTSSTSDRILSSAQSVRRRLLGGAAPAPVGGASRRGASGIEYGMIVGLVAVVAIVATQTTGERVRDIFSNAGQEISDRIAAAVEIGVEVGAGVGAGVDDIAEDILIFLTGGALPAVDNATALSVDFSTLDFLEIEGADPSELSWSAGVSPIPAGLTLDPDLGVLSGAIPAGGSYEFEIVASIGADEGRAVYTIEVNGVRLAVTDITAGRVHSCAILAADGSVVCWGGGSSGQLGLGNTSSSFIPVAVPGLGAGVKAISAGFGHTCAIDAAGAAKCWGQNDVGQLGRGSVSAAPGVSPSPVTGLASGVKAISAGTFHTCAIDAAGAAKCWGSGTNGRIGDNAIATRSSPSQVSGHAAGIVSISAGEAHTCAVNTVGGATCWGAFLHGRLGAGTLSVDQTTPIAVSGLGAGVQKIVAGNLHTCAIVAGGGAKCWGHGANGRLGDGTATTAWTPVDVSGLGAGVIDLSVDDSHSCAVVAGGGAKCWGLGSLGRLGVGDQADRIVPTQVLGLSSGVSAISAGQFHSCAIVDGGAMRCWGRGANGQLGTVAHTDSLTPVDVYAPPGI